MDILLFYINRKSIYYFVFISCLHSIINIDDIELTHSVNNENIIELNSFYIINRISGIKSDNDPYNYLLGIFEASNDITFSDALPIALIKEEHIQNIKNNEINIAINIPNPYKYIRYIPPNQNEIKLDQIKIFGHEFSETEDLSNKKFFTVTNLPLMIFNTENSIEPTSNEEYIISQIIIINDNEKELNETAKIRIRGHSTATLPKKPYKIKFEKKQKIFGISGKYKNWALLANHYDKSLIRNSLAFKISEIIGLEFTPRCEPVDVILNGNYRGNYFICDQIEVKEGRVDIEEITEDDITGGYLLEIDGRAMKEDKYFLSDRGLIGEIKYPDSDDITKKQENYIKLYLNKMETNVYKGNLDYLDLNSFYRYFIMQEFCADIDSVWSSFHVTKRKGDDKLYFGPVWDYDLSFDNDGRLAPTNNKTKFSFYYGKTAGSARDFIITILKANNTIIGINETWNEIRENGLNFETLENFIEQKTDLLLESANLNFLRWFGSQIGEGKRDYLKNVDVVSNYIEQRFDSLSNLINTYDFGGTRLKINYCVILLILLILF